MAGIRLEFAQFGHFDYFDILRSETSMLGLSELELPTPIATSLKTMYYVDMNVVLGSTYYYKIRVVRGSDKVLSNEISVKAQSNDTYWGNVVALLHFDGNLVDEKANTWTANNSNTFVSGIFGNAIELKSTQKQCLYSSTGIGDFGSGDFTVEFFIKFKGFNTSSCVITGGWNYNTSKRTWGFLLGDGADRFKLHFYCSSNGTTAYSVAIPSGQLTADIFYHIAAVRNGSTFKLFINGKSVGSSSFSGAIYSDLSSGVTVGTYFPTENNNSYYVDAVFDELRITKGICRYIDDFDVPSAPFLSH